MNRLALVILACLVSTQSSSAADASEYQPHDKTRSMFLDEVSLEQGLRVEEFYGLKEGRSYDITFQMRKDPGKPRALAYVNVLAYVTSDIEKKGKKRQHVLLERLGDDVPADDQWHTVRGEFATTVPEGSRFTPNVNGAFAALLVLYNKGKQEGHVSIRNMSGVPKYVTYEYLGAKDRSLPQLLLIGDSTMMHTYASTVKAFEGIAAVHYIPVNGGSTAASVGKVRRWVGGRKWDLIYFNSGIHDLTRQNEKGERGPDHPHRVSPQEYAENLQIIVDYLKSTEAKLLWRSITPFDNRAIGRLEADERSYNSSATGIMQKNGIPVHDVTSARREELLRLSRDGVHFNAEGNELLANELLLYVKKHRLLP